MNRSLRAAVTAGLCTLGLLQFAHTAKAGETTDAANAADAADAANAADPPAAETWSVHGQFTNVTQQNSAFHAPYSGDNSLSNSRVRRETSDITLYLGARLWQGAELYLNPEMNQASA